MSRRTSTSERVRVLWAIKQLGPGGSERLLLTAARRHDHARFELHATYLLRGNDELAPALAARGVEVHCLEVDNALDLRWITRLRQLLVTGGFDVLHVHSPLLAGVARPLLATIAAARRPELVITEHGAWQHYALVTRLLNLATLPVGAAHIAVSEEARRSLPWWLRRSTQVVIHGVPVDELVPLRVQRSQVRAELGVSDDEIMVLTVANLRGVKDYPNLLRAACIVIDEMPSVRMFAAGGGSLDEELHARQRALALGHRFQFLGFRADAVRLMAGADVFVLSSREEGYPVAVMEAMAMGLPVVATAVGGVPEAVRHGVEGLIVPSGEPERLAEAIMALASSPVRRAACAGAATRRGRDYDVDATARAMEGIYDRLAGRGAP